MWLQMPLRDHWTQGDVDLYEIGLTLCVAYGRQFIHRLQTTSWRRKEGATGGESKSGGHHFLRMANAYTRIQINRTENIIHIKKHGVEKNRTHVKQ